MKVKLRVKAGAPRNGFLGVEEDGTIRVAISARPKEGEANEALIRFLAREFGLSPKEITITSGKRSRSKVVELTGITPEKLMEIAK
ncbi:MAG: DUF167 domain-containing protein [candidate division WOR-3 bacterium]